MTAITLPHSALTGRSAFVKLGARAHLVISIASVAVRLAEEDGRVGDIALAVGACAPFDAPPAEATLASMIEGMDKSLGDIMTALERLRVADNTIILRQCHGSFMSR